MSIVMKVKVGRAAKGRLLIRIQGLSMNDLVVSDGVVAKVRQPLPGSSWLPTDRAQGSATADDQLGRP